MTGNCRHKYNFRNPGMRMRLIIIFIFGCFLVASKAGSVDHCDSFLYPPPDTIPPPSPGGAVLLNGPSSACTGETSQYSADVPVACTCLWYVNGILQPETTSPLIITWTQPGLKTISLVFSCSGILSDPETTSTIVYDIPDEPGPISGDTLVCEYTYHNYSVEAGPYDSCQWTVNGVVMQGYSPVITYSFSDAGNYHFEVIIFNPCGTSAPQALDVRAQGSAPAPPSPIQGPAESCEGLTDTYTTTVGPGESCSWRIDGVLQSSSSTTLVVIWSEWGGHQIEVRAVSGCGTGNPAVKDVMVMYQPVVFLGNDTTILQGQALLLDAGNPGSDYLWSTGETTRTILVSSTGTYSVNVSNFCGSDSDTIDVSVIVGIDENGNDPDCFVSGTGQKMIILSDMPQETEKIQVFTVSGKVCYNGPPVSEIRVGNAGIYFIRVITKTSSCYKKALVP